MFLKHIDLTTALRPSYLADEVLLFVQDNVGLYEGKFKLPDFQDGQVYLTSHRICYVDNQKPRSNSKAIDLKDVERYEFYAGFLKSSAKITLFPKPSKRSSIQNRNISSLNGTPRSATASPLSRADSPLPRPTTEPPPQSTATWVCPICSFSNLVPSNFDWQTANERTPLPPCLMCGIKPPYSLVFKAAIASATSRPPPSSALPVRAPIPLRGVSIPSEVRGAQDQQDGWPNISQSDSMNSPRSNSSGVSFQCPSCTFQNHPSLLACELCGTPLISQVPARPDDISIRPDSPGPMLTSSTNPSLDHSNEIIKLSFRRGGEKVFHERLKGSMVQRKWLLQDAPPVPTPSGFSPSSSAVSTPSGERVKTGGIAGLEQMRREERNNNEIVIGNAFEDLEALMASAKEIIALAESFRGSNGASDTYSSTVADALGLVTTKDMLGGGSSSESLYISQLSRNLAEFLTDDARGILRKAGGIVSLVDLWAMFNRARGGVELVSPLDFEKAARMWETLKLPVRLRQFRSGVLVVQGSDRTDEKTIKALLGWLADLHVFPPERELAWDWQYFGRGVTAQDTAERFGWSIGIAEEELEMAEEKGALCREEGLEGTKFWENWIDDACKPGSTPSYNTI